MDEQEASRQIVLELQVACKNLGADANPVCGLFAIDQQSGELDFLSHTEVMRAAPHPKFGKLLTCNFFPGRNQKLQLNIYSAPWKDNIVDNSIKDEDRIGSVIIALDKVVPVNALSRDSFAPVACELPMWHDSEPAMNDRLAAAGASMKVAFKASENQPEQFFAGSGPQADQNIHQALAMMIAGGEFLKYPFGSSGAPQKRFVWYDKMDGPMGTLYWGEQLKKKKDKKKSIPIHTITGLFEQNQTDAFRKHQKKMGADRSNRCFSVVGKDRTLDLEAKSKEVVDAFMTGIHRILSGSGFGVKEVTTQDKDELLSAPVVKNTFIIRAKLRNLPSMPWGHDEPNDTLVTMAEKLPNTTVFKPLEQTEWQKGNSNPNFEKELVLPFVIPPTAHPIKFNVYDYQLNDKHLMGSSVVRLDFFYRYAGQEMMVKLRNAHPQDRRAAGGEQRLHAADGRRREPHRRLGHRRGRRHSHEHERRDLRVQEPRRRRRLDEAVEAAALLHALDLGLPGGRLRRDVLERHARQLVRPGHRVLPQRGAVRPDRAVQ